VRNLKKTTQNVFPQTLFFCRCNHPDSPAVFATWRCC